MIQATIVNFRRKPRKHSTKHPQHPSLLVHIYGILHDFVLISTLISANLLSETVLSSQINIKRTTRHAHVSSTESSILRTLFA